MAELGTPAWITTGVLAGLVVLFATEKFRPDVLAVLGLVVLAGAEVVDVTTALTGFAHPAVVTVVAFFVLSSAISDAGIPQAIARGLFRVTGSS
ncbi:MAG: SLC13 family permease, partial [Chloroflexota bacterium]|nr:SLC13 family permease [Chloroflexota bacterium]